MEAKIVKATQRIIREAKKNDTLRFVEHFENTNSAENRHPCYSSKLCSNVHHNSEVTPRLLRQKVEEELDLDAGALNEAEHKKLVSETSAAVLVSPFMVFTK